MKLDKKLDELVSEQENQKGKMPTALHKRTHYSQAVPQVSSSLVAIRKL